MNVTTYNTKRLALKNGFTKWTLRIGRNVQFALFPSQHRLRVFIVSVWRELDRLFVSCNSLYMTWVEISRDIKRCCFFFLVFRCFFCSLPPCKTAAVQTLPFWEPRVESLCLRLMTPVLYCMNRSKHLVQSLAARGKNITAMATLQMWTTV